MSTRLRVGVDAHMLGTAETGNESYVRGLLGGLAELEDGPDALAYVRGDHGLPPGPNLRHLRLPGAAARLGVELPWRSRRDRLHVLHSTYVAPAAPGAAVVLMVHDVTYLTHPQWLSARDVLVLRLGVARSIRRAAQVVVPTRAVREEVLEVYGLDPQRVRAIHHGPGAAARRVPADQARQVLARLGLAPTGAAARPYLLAVGAANPRKNLRALIEAFGRVTGFDGALVLAGGAVGSRAPEVAAAAEASPARVVTTPPLTDDDLAALYQQASAVVVPSLHEGFGLPALEAMWHGVPLAVSAVPALLEVTDGAAIGFDPRNADAMTAALTTLLTDSRERQRLVDAGGARAAAFSWLASAREHAEVYRLAASS